MIRLKKNQNFTKGLRTKKKKNKDRIQNLNKLVCIANINFEQRREKREKELKCHRNCTVMPKSLCAATTGR